MPDTLRSLRGPLMVGGVLALAGLMFVASASSAATTRRPQDLADLAQVTADQVVVQAQQVDDLRAEVDRLSSEASDAPGLTAETPELAVAAGAVEVTGPGLVVVLDDAPADARPADVSPDVLVVHQQDVQAVINALWAGGAEAIAVQDQRVISTNAVRCVGNVLRIGGRLYSPPYTISAIGPAESMRMALDDSAAVQAYQRDAQEVGLGWAVSTEPHLDLPAYSGATDLQYATVPEGTDVLADLGLTPAPQETP
jgi:uncharacterized protein YlxW (UPF0749 family)